MTIKPPIVKDFPAKSAGEATISLSKIREELTVQIPDADPSWASAHVHLILGMDPDREWITKWRSDQVKPMGDWPEGEGAEPTIRTGVTLTIPKTVLEASESPIDLRYVFSNESDDYRSQPLILTITS